MSALAPIQKSFDHLLPDLPAYIGYRVQRAIKDDGNAAVIFHYTLNHLYRKHLSIASIRTVVCSGVAHDGLGDLTHQVHASTILKRRLLIPHTAMVSSMTNFQKRKSILQGQILEAAHECLFAENFTDDPELQAKAQKAVDTAEVVVKVATGSLNTQLRGLSLKGAPHVLDFSELGLGFTRRLGFGPQDVGVPIPLEKEVTNLDEPELEALLAERSHRPNYSFHFGYLKQYSSQNAFFAICCLTAKVKDASIDLILPIKDICIDGWTDKEESIDGEVEFAWILERLGLKQVTLYTKDKDNKLICKQTRVFKETGLDVRIINPFPVSSDSFAFLSSQGKWFTGCTGDFSFLETALDKTPKIPFYEIVGHKRNFYYAFIDFLREQLPEGSPLFSFFQSLLVLRENPPVKELFRIVQDIAELFQAPEIHLEMKTLSDFIKKHFDFNEVLLDDVLREAAHVRYPKLQTLEQ